MPEISIGNETSNHIVNFMVIKFIEWWTGNNLTQSAMTAISLKRDASLLSPTKKTWEQRYIQYCSVTFVHFKGSTGKF